MNQRLPLGLIHFHSNMASWSDRGQARLAVLNARWTNPAPFFVLQAEKLSLTAGLRIFLTNF
jgi:hypothetical protein